MADADVGATWALAQRVLTPHAAALAIAAWPGETTDLVALQKAVMAHERARALSAERLQPCRALSPRLRALSEEGRAISGERHAAHLAQVCASRPIADARFDRHEVLLSPSTTGAAPPGTDAAGDPLFCCGWTLLGLPCIHLPFGSGRNGLPVGLQLVGRQGGNHGLLACGHWCWHRLAALGRCCTAQQVHACRSPSRLPHDQAHLYKSTFEERPLASAQRNIR